MSDIIPDKIQGTRAKRKKKNENMSEYVIKASLVNSLTSRAKDEFKDDILNSIYGRVEAMSKGMQRLSLAMNLFIKDSFDREEDPCDVVLPNFLSGKKDTTFARQLMLGTEEARIPNENVEKFLLFRNNLLPDIQVRFQGDRNTISSAAEQYLTNFRTYIDTTFYKKQSTFIKLWCSENDVDDSRIVNDIINGNPLRINYVIPYNLHIFTTFHRKLLGLRNTDRLNESFIKNNYEKIIVYYEMMSRYQIEKGSPGIASAPLCNMKSIFIHIDSDVFYGLLKEADLIDVNFATFNEDRNDYWNDVFNTSKYLTVSQRANNSFTCTIQTDGVSICIHYRRPKPELELQSVSKTQYVSEIHSDIVDSGPYHVDRKDGDRVIGQDPGRVLLFSGSEQMSDGTWKKYKLSRGHLYEQAGLNKAVRKSNIWNMSIKKQLEQLSTFNTRSSIKEFLGYMKVIKDNYDVFWSEYLKKKWARQRLGTYSGKKKVYDIFFNSLKDKSGRRIVVAYGDAGFVSSSRYEKSAPTTRLIRETRKHFKVVMVNEHNTTQMHYDTGTRLFKVANKLTDVEGKKHVKSVRGLLWCNSTKGSKFFVDRDFNSSKQMVKLYNLYPERPNELKNSKDQEGYIKKPKPVYKYIKKLEKQAKRSQTV